MKDYVESYAYRVDIRFTNGEELLFFYDELLVLIDWLAENYGLSTEVPDFFGLDFPFQDYLAELGEEIDNWNSKELPTVEEDDSLIIEAYTDYFVSMISELAENYDIESIEVDELISEEDLATEIVFEEDEYESSDTIGLESSFDDIEEF